MKVPLALLVQARSAACNNIGLDIILHRYFFGYTLVSEFCLRESAELKCLEATEVHQLIRDLTACFNRLIRAVTSEHLLETRRREAALNDSTAVRVRSLLAGDRGEAELLDYEFTGWHLGIVTVGSSPKACLLEAAARLDRRLLIVPESQGQTWAWLGGRAKLSATEFERTIGQAAGKPSLITVGEPAEGLSGWRLSHSQALAAIPIARMHQRSIVLYSSHALLASMVQDDVLIRSLKQIYLAPLESGRDGGRNLRRTLRAYLDADGHISSAAAALGVSRKTVANRLSAVEDRLGKPLASCTPDLEAALLLDETMFAPG